MASGEDVYGLDELVAQLYDDLQSKVQASNMIFLLISNIDSLGGIASHGSAIVDDTAIEDTWLPTNFSSIHGGHDQEKFLYMSVHLLLNVAEDVQIEKKMRKCNLVVCLSNLLLKANPMLLSIVLLFLKKLSIFKENLDAMKETSVIFKLLRILNLEDEPLLDCTLRLLHNLSFERGLKEDMVECGYLYTFKGFLQQKKFEQLVWGILYNLSMDVDLRLKFTDSDVVPTLFESILLEQSSPLPQELIALAINLTHLPKSNMLILQTIKEIIGFVLHRNETLLFKVIKNLSLVDSFKDQFVPFLPALVAVLSQCEPCIQVEVMGTLNNLACIEEAREFLLSDTGLVNYLVTQLHVFNMEDDVNLQIIMFIGAVCLDKSAPIITQAGLVSKLCDVFLHRHNDLDITLQSLYALNHFLLYDSTKEAFFCLFEKVVSYILELTKSNNKAIQIISDHVIEVICEVDESRSCRIRNMKFNVYNEGWLSHGLCEI